MFCYLCTTLEELKNNILRINYIFSGRSREKLSEYYFFWAEQILTEKTSAWDRSDIKKVKKDYELAKEKNFVQNTYFIRLFEFATNFLRKYEDFKEPLMKRLQEAIVIYKKYPGANVFGRIFYSTEERNKAKDVDKVHNFLEGEFDIQKVSEHRPSKDYFDFLAFLLLGMDIDEFKDAGEVDGLTFEADVKEVDLASLKVSKESSHIGSARLLTSIPALDFESKVIAREGPLHRLHNKIKKGYKRIQLYGVGGIGKSILALSYIKISLDEWDNVVWIEQSQDIVSSFTSNAQLRESLKISLLPNEKNEDLFMRMMLAMDKLKGRNLLVIDNLATDFLTDKHARFIPSSNHWTLLVTQRGPIEGFEQLEVDAMHREIAKKFFRQHFKKAITKKVESKLLKTIEYHPLTIELIAKTLMASRRITPELMLDRLQNLELDKLKDAPSLSSKEKRLYSYLLTTFKLVEEDFDEFSLGVIRGFSIIIPQLIPIDDLVLLFGIEDGLLDQFDDAINSLYRSGWISLYPNTSTLQIHRMVRDTLYYQLQPTTEELEFVISQLANILSGTEEAQLPVELFKWAPFAEYITILMRGEKHVVLEELNEKFINLLSYKGEIDKSIKYAQVQLNLFERELGHKSPKVSNARASLAALYLQNEDIQLAIEELEVLIPLDTELYGASDIRVFTHRRDLALAILMNGEDWNAKSLLEDLRPELEDHFGRNHHLVHSLNMTLSDAYKELGMLQEGKALIEEVVEYERIHLPPFHYQLGASLSRLSVILGELGDNVGAKELLNEVFEIVKKNFGESHPEVATCYLNLASQEWEDGNLEKAYSYCEQCIEIENQFYTKNHPALIMPYRVKALILQQNGETGLGENLLKETIIIAEETYPPMHSVVVLLKTDLAAIYLDQSCFDEGIEILVEILEKSKNKYGSIHPVTASIQVQFGELLKNAERLSEAMALFTEAIATYQELFGDNHYSTLLAFDGLGRTLSDLGEEDKAVEILNKSLNVASQLFGENHQTYGASLKNLAIVLEKNGDLEKSKQYYENALKIAEQVYGKKHKETLEIYANIGSVLLSMEQFEEAEKILTKAYHQITEDGTFLSEFGFTVHNNLISALLGGKKEAAAKRELENLFEGQLTVYGINDPDTFSTCIRLIRIVWDGANKDESREYLMILEECLSNIGDEEYLTSDLMSAYTFLGKYYEGSNSEKSTAFYALSMTLLFSSSTNAESKLKRKSRRKLS